MTQYGDYQEPGIVTSVTSALGQPTAGEAPGDVGIVGQAHLGNSSEEGDADPNTVYAVENARDARGWFGHEDDANSMLTQACIDALNEGAFPLYVVAAESTEHTQDISSAGSTSITLDNTPIREDDITVTLGGSDVTTVKVYDEPSSYTVESGEAYYNPVTGNVEINSTPESGDEITYESFDYDSAIEAMSDNAGDVIDFLAPLNEASSVVDKANSVVGNMETEYELAVALGGAGINVDPNNYDNPYDDSRTQLIYGTRFADGSSLLGAYAGRRAAIGIDTTPVRQRLQANKEVHSTQAENLSRADRGTLIDNKVVPIKPESGGARIMDDVTTVTPENSDEYQLDYGFERLVTDYVIETTRNNQQPFIGRLNTPAVRNSLEALVDEQLKAVKNSNAILDYNISVSSNGATKAIVDMQMETAEPLRFIDNQITVGEIA